MPEIAAQKQSLTRQTAWILTAKIASYALTIAVPLILARRLDQTEFGQYKAIFLVIMTANAILPFSFGASAYFFLPRETGARRAGAVANIFLFNLGVGLLAFLTLFFYPQILNLIFHDAAIVGFAPALGAAILLWIFSSFLETLVIANQEASLAMIFIVFAQFTKAVFFVTAAIFVGSIESLIWAAIAQAALQTVVLLVYANSRFRGFWSAFDFGLFRQQFSYTLPFGLGGWFSTAQTDLHNYFVTSRFTAAEFAVYAVGCFDLPLIGILAESVSAVLIPAVSRLQASGDKREIIETTARVARKLALVYFPLYAFLLVVADTFLIALFTDKFSDSIPIFRLNITLLPFAVLVLDPISRAYKQIGYFLLKLRVVLFVLMTTALVFATNSGNLLAINAVVVVFALVERGLSTTRILREIGFRKIDFRLFASLARAAAAAAVAGIALFLLHFFAAPTLPQIFAARIESVLTSFGIALAAKIAAFAGASIYLAICAAVFALAYASLANVFGAVEPDEKQKIVALIRKPFARFNKMENTVSAETRLSTE